MQQQPLAQTNGYGAQHTAGVIEVVCGPLINFQRLNYAGTSATWYGTVLIVAKPTDTTPRLDYGPTASRGETISVEGLKLYQDPDKAFWRFSLEVPLTEVQAQWTYHIPNIRFLSDVHKDEGRRNFFVTATQVSDRSYIFRTMS